MTEARAHTFEEIGRELGVSPQATQQIFERAMEKLRRAVRTRPWLTDALWTELEGNSLPYPRGAFRPLPVRQLETQEISEDLW